MKNIENSANQGLQGEWQKLAEDYEKAPSFDELMEKISATDISVLTSQNNTNKEEAKAEFFENPNLRKPNNRWDKLNGPKYQQNLETLTEVEKDVKTGFLSQPERALAETVSGFITLKNELALSSYNYNNAENAEDKLVAAREHDRVNKEMYGLPDKDTFYSLLDQKINSIDYDGLSPEDKAEYDEMIEMIGEREIPEKPAYRPKEETVKQFGEMIEMFYGNLFQHIPEGKEAFTTAEARDIMNEAIAEEIGPETGWKVELNSKSGMASVNPDKKTVKLPEKRNMGDYTRTALKAILAHELGTHAMRSIAYEEANIDAFKTSVFPGREVSEEGIAKAMEQAIAGTYDDPTNTAPTRYIEIGLIEHKNTDFRQTFEIIKRLEHLTGGWNEDMCFENVQRAFRGTGELLNSKDLAYYNGNIEAWKYIEGHLDDPNLFDDLFLSGKTDPFDQDQQRLTYEMKTGSLA